MNAIAAYSTVDSSRVQRGRAPTLVSRELAGIRLAAEPRMAGLSFLCSPFDPLGRSSASGLPAGLLQARVRRGSERRAAAGAAAGVRAVRAAVDERRIGESRRVVRAARLGRARAAERANDEVRVLAEVLLHEALGRDRIQQDVARAAVAVLRLAAEGTEALRAGRAARRRPARRGGGGAHVARRAVELGVLVRRLAVAVVVVAADSNHGGRREPGARVGGAVLVGAVVVVRDVIRGGIAGAVNRWRARAGHDRVRRAGIGGRDRRVSIAVPVIVVVGVEDRARPAGRARRAGALSRRGAARRTVAAGEVARAIAADGSRAATDLHAVAGLAVGGQGAGDTVAQLRGAVGAV